MSSKKYMGKYTKKQMSFIIGMWLGDGYITKHGRGNSFLGCQHSKNQKEYLEYKKQRLEELGFKISKTYDVSNNYGDAYRFEMRNPELLNQLRSVLYPKNNKTVKRKWLNYLNAESLAIWFMDDGSLTKRGKSAYASLHTNSFNKKEHDIIIRYFKQVWKITPTLRIVKRRDRDQTFFLTFSVEETKKLIDIVKPFVIDSMKYKVDLT